jgi:multidrug efflux pump subunit AcrB
MNIPRFFIKNWQFTVCIFLLVSYWGVSAFKTMPKSEDPLFPTASFNVITVYPGATPIDIEQLIVKPLEKDLGTLEKIDFIKTTINDGVAAINIQFLQGVDVTEKLNEVEREVNGERPNFPAGVKSVEVIQGSTSNVNVLQYAVTTDEKSYRDLQVVAEHLQTEIRKVGGVKKVSIDALPVQQISLSLDLSKMLARGVTLSNIFNAVQSEATIIPGGYLDVTTNRYNLKTNGDYNTVRTISETVVKTNNGGNVHLGDLATVTESYEKKTYIGRYNGHKAVFVSANQQDGTNIFSVTEQVEQKVAPYLNATPGIKIIKLFDQSKSVTSRLDDLYRDFIIAILLVLFTLLPLGMRASYVVMFAIPTSIFIGLTLLYLTGYSINQFSIVGLVIALGLLVDDSIIVVENIVAKLRKGLNRETAAIDGTNQLLPAIVAVTTCILLSFLPLLTLPGSTGAFIRSMPLAVVFTMAGSLFVSMSLTPLMSGYILKESIGDNVFYRAVMKLNEGPFLKLLHQCLKYPRTTLLIALVLSLSGFGLFRVIGITFFPGAEKPQFIINATLPLQSNIEVSDSVCRRVEAELRRHPQIISYASNIGKGNPMVYYNYAQGPQKTNMAQLFCTVDHYDRIKTPALWDSLRTVFSDYVGVQMQVKEFIQGPAVNSPIEIRLMGDSLSTLDMLAAQVEQLMDKTPGAVNIHNPLREKASELKIDVNHDKAVAAGVSTAEIDRTISMAFAGLPAGIYPDNIGNQYNIVLTLADSALKNFNIFHQLYLSSASGQLIPLSQIASYHFQLAVPTLEHYDQQRSITLTSDVKTGYLTNNVTNAIIEAVSKLPMPTGYSFMAGGEIEKRKESFGGLATALYISIFAIVAVLILAFNGARATLIVASAIPLGIFGSTVALWLGGYTFSFTAFIGIVTLVGLEVKNTIIIVDFTNQMRRAGHPVDKAIELAREERFTPIFLTTLTAVFALLPLVMEHSAFFSPLALVLIGGLLSSLLLTRFVEPVFYKLLIKDTGDKK